MEEVKSSYQQYGIPRLIALIILLFGAVVSIGMLLNEGRRTPIALLVLFIGWVLSPFAAILLIQILSKRKLVTTPPTFYRLMLLFSIISPGIYFIVLNQHLMRPAAIFLIVPFLAWVVILLVVWVSRVHM